MNELSHVVVAAYIVRNFQIRGCLSQPRSPPVVGSQGCYEEVVAVVLHVGGLQLGLDYLWWGLINNSC